MLTVVDICAAVQGGDVPMTEMFGTFALSVGAAVSGRDTAKSLFAR